MSPIGHIGQPFFASAQASDCAGKAAMSQRRDGIVSRRQRLDRRACSRACRAACGECRSEAGDRRVAAAVVQGQLQQQQAAIQREPAKKPRIAGSLRGISGKKSGGQRGHRGETLRPVADPDKIERHAATQCGHCRAALTAMATRMEKRQVFEMPQPRLEVTEHQAFIYTCACCRGETRAAFPADVTAHMHYGPRIRAVVQGKIALATGSARRIVAVYNAIIRCGFTFHEAQPALARRPGARGRSPRRVGQSSGTAARPQAGGAAVRVRLRRALHQQSGRVRISA